jgi:hypothetical protein
MSKIYWSWSNIGGSLKRVYQNIFRGWNDSDLWNLDWNIAEYILPRLKRLKEIKKGYPSNIDDPKQWESILDKMIKSFEYIIIDSQDIELKDSGCDLKCVGRDGNTYLEYVGTQEEKDLNEKYLNEYREKLIEREKEIEHGLYLFSKYFRNLWD